MGEQILKDCKFYFNGYDLSGDMNQASLNHSADLKDNSVFSSSARKRIPGLKDTEASAGGFWNTSTGLKGTDRGKPDKVLFGEIGASSGILSIVPNGTGLGNVAYFHKGVVGSYSPGGSIGDMLAFTAAFQGKGDLVRGSVLECGNLSTALSVTGRNVGAGSTLNDKIYAALHLLSVNSSGDQMRLTIQGASENGFTAATTYLIWTQGTIDDGAPGEAYFTSTKLASTKHNWFRAQIETTSGSTDSQFNGILNVGIQ